MRKLLMLSIFGMALVTFSHAQSISKATIGGSGGQFRNGNISLGFTLGESIVGLRPGSGYSLSNGFWAVVPTTYVSAATLVYRFTGTGNFFESSNWLNGVQPPNPLPGNAEIIIDPPAEGQCLLALPYSVSVGGKISVAVGKKFIVAGNLKVAVNQ